MAEVTMDGILIGEAETKNIMQITVKGGNESG